MGLSSVTYVDQSERERLLIKGQQAHWFLDQLLTNRIEGLAPGQGCEALLLTPKGRIVAISMVDCLGPDELLMTVDSDGGFSMAGFLSSRVFSTRVEIEDVTRSLGLVRIMGSGAPRFVASLLGSEPPVDENSNSVGSQGLVAVARSRPAPGWDVWFAKDSELLQKRLSEAGATEIPEGHWESIRIAGGMMSFERDLSAGFLPQEAALERAVHFSKGCYLGQEAVAMAQRGRTQKRFRLLQFSGHAAEQEIFYEGKKVGTLTSSADREEHGFGMGPIATSVPVGVTVQIGNEPGIEALVSSLPGEVTGPSVPSARELRERLADGTGDR